MDRSTAEPSSRGGTLIAAGGSLPADAIAGLCAHPRFSQAVRVASRGVVGLYRGNRLLNLVTHDRGRMVVGLLALDLHLSRRPGDPDSGLTVNRLKAVCAEHGICSPGRTRAMLALMRLAGYLAPAPEAADRRLQLLVPTERLTASLRERWACVLGAAALVRPEAAEAAAALDRAAPDVMAALGRLLMAHFRAGFRLLEHAPELHPFAGRNAGFVILLSLVAAGEEDDTVPPMRPVAVSVSELARRFAVSRAQVVRLMRDAADRGLIERSGTPLAPRITILPPLAQAVRHFFATLFLLLAHCGVTAMAEIDGRPSRDVAA